MSSLLIRCHTCTSASALEFTDWLEGKASQLRSDALCAVRLTRLVEDLPEATADAGWLLEVELDGERPQDLSDPQMSALEETLGDMRVLGLDPILLVPTELPLGESTGASAGWPTADREA